MSANTYTIEDICTIVKGELLLQDSSHSEIEHLLTDSRTILDAEGSLFFAIKGDRNDGHRFIEELINKGVRNFVVSRQDEKFKTWPANFILVSDTLEALQLLCAHHRKKFLISVIGITGSNGKTVVKEWLYQLLREDKNIVRSPKSYNSQIGVPLSVWQINSEHQLALIEAGISKPGEMEKLEKVVQPSVGIITNIGQAHDENFANQKEKVDEKLRLFANAGTLIYCKDYLTIQDEISSAEILPNHIKLFAWSRRSKADLQVGRITKRSNETEIQGVYKNDFIKITIPFTDEASIENAVHCWALMLYMNYDQQVIEERMKLLSPVAMRLELKEGINNCSVINDSYNSDLGSLNIALDFLLHQKQHDKRTVVLSDILQSGRSGESLYKEVSEMLSSKGITRLIGIGEAITNQAEQFKGEKKFYKTTDEFLKVFLAASFKDETILLKGARPFGFERISKVLQQKAHETVMEINLNAIVHNLNYFRTRLKPGTKIMAMVKAFSYGSGSFEIANLLQFHRVDYLAVAFTDEGIELRKAGITLPIIVMNPEMQSFEAMIQYQLEPEIYSFRLLNQLDIVLKKYYSEELIQPLNIHLKLDTGMHRLGFEEPDLNELIVRLQNNKYLKIQSIFSHLAASDEPEHDAFTRHQHSLFMKMSHEVMRHFNYPILRHILNSGGVIRFQESQLDMVRLGIGLYGIAPTSHEQNHLQQVATLKTIISQIKNIPVGETVGYSRKGKVSRQSQVATVAIGYADGLNRKLSNGIGKMLVNGRFAPIIGNVSMDTCMIDITDAPAKEGDEVIVFGNEYPVMQIAKTLDTIPYEVLVNISQRVKRVYFQE